MSGPELSRRQVLAFIALADAPPPTVISFRDEGDIELSFHGPGATASLQTWMKLLNADEHGYRGPKLSADGEQLLSHLLSGATIGGHRVVLWSHEPAAAGGTDEPLDEATREQLQQLVDGRTEDVVDQVLAEPLAQLDAMKSALEQQLVDCGMCGGRRAIAIGTSAEEACPECQGTGKVLGDGGGAS